MKTEWLVHKPTKNQSSLDTQWQRSNLSSLPSPWFIMKNCTPFEDIIYIIQIVQQTFSNEMNLNRTNPIPHIQEKQTPESSNNLLSIYTGI